MTDTSKGQHCFCYKCGHFWYSASDSHPKRCPRCHSSRWDVPVVRERVCRFCGHTWEIDDIDEPCPVCGRRQSEGDTDRMLHCNQCDYDWIRKGDTLPKRCPLCHSNRWNEPKTIMLKCHNCDHVWKSQTERPKRCPRCQSARWDEELRFVKCQRCGHGWTLRGKEEPKACPSCKSVRWNEAPNVYECPRCKRVTILRSNTSVIKCPYCDRSGKRMMTCRICGNVWSDSVDATVCPRCYNRISLNDGTTRTTLWTDERYRMEYICKDGFGYLYLWDGDVPVATRYMHDVCDRFSMTIDQLVRSISEEGMNERMSVLKDEMVARENSYAAYIDYFMKRLSLTYDDARILAIHFTGMGPEAISIKFGLSIDSVRASFDRIMEAYSKKGIVVDDTIFTENPFVHYGDER